MRKEIYTKHQIETARESLKALAEKENVKMTKSKFIETLKTEIMAARESGKSWKEIAASLKEAGVDVSFSLIIRMFKNPGEKSKQKENLKTYEF